MNASLKPLFALAAAASIATGAAGGVTVTAVRSLGAARPAEVITVPWSAVAAGMHGARPEKLVIRDSKGASLPYQFTNANLEDRNGAYEDVLFQHDFAAGERAATFTIEAIPLPALPFPVVAFARYVPERYDDFAWENDRIAHRIYGPALDSPAAGRSRMVSSGIDVWAKRVRYPIVDRWYIRGHNNYHKDNGEGLDFYSVGTGRGCGGSGIWDGKTLHVSHEWASWKVLANGPLRAVFELTYAPWDAGGGVWVSEVKRFTVDGGRNLDAMQSTFTFAGAPELTAALGLGKHPRAAMSYTPEADAGWFSEWEQYPRPPDSGLGTGLVLAPGSIAGTAEDAANHLVLVKVKSGVPVRYLAGAGWTKSGDFSGESDWKAYLAGFAARLADPVRVSVAPEK